MQCRPTWYQIEGTDGDRCGSFASSGIPVEVSAPETTHEFEPTPLPEGSAGPSTEGIWESSWESCASFCCAAEGSVAAAVAFCSYVDPTSAPCVTIVECVEYGYDGYSCSIWSTDSVRVNSERAISLSTFARRSQAIASIHATESIGVHGAGL